jgi:hypothetical protein
MGFAGIVAGFGMWWLALQGILADEIEFTTKASGSEIWYARLDAPLPFWFVVTFYFIAGLFFMWLGYVTLRKEKAPSAIDE